MGLCIQLISACWLASESDWKTGMLVAVALCKWSVFGGGGSSRLSKLK